MKSVKYPSKGGIFDYYVARPGLVVSLRRENCVKQRRVFKRPGSARERVRYMKTQGWLMTFIVYIYIHTHTYIRIDMIQMWSTDGFVKHNRIPVEQGDAWMIQGPREPPIEQNLQMLPPHSSQVYYNVGPLVISWFGTPSNYGYNHHKP